MTARDRGVGEAALLAEATPPRPAPLQRPPLLRTILWERKSSGLGAVFVAILVTSSLLAPVLAPYDPARQHLTQRYSPPSAQFLLGTDSFGRDILSRLLWGGRNSLLVAIVVVAIATVLGGAVGIVTGYWGGWVDRVLTFVVELLMAVPLLLLAIVFIALLGPGLVNVMLAIGVGSVPMFARVLRAEVRALRERDFVTAGRALGGTTGRLLWAHVLPNVTATLTVLATTRIATAVLTEASLSFLGIGLRPPTPSWGIMVAEGRAFLDVYPWISLVPGAVIMLVVLGFNLLGDGLRDALDVRLTRGRGRHRQG